MHDDVVMKVLFQVLCALVATMAIVHSENLYLWPVRLLDLWLLAERLDHIQNNGNSVLICLSDKAHMGVGCERLDYTEFLVGSL